MKKKLLITMGCSMTEGDGCYDYNINPGMVLYGELPLRERLITLERFHKYGWPNLVGKEVGFNKVINLGKGGSSNCLQLKLFVDKIVSKIQNLQREYDVYLIWMMTEASRFSFYTDNSIMKFQPSAVGKKPYSHKMDHAYLMDLPEVKVGPIREQVHLMKLAQFMFDSLGIKYVFTSCTEQFNDVYSYFKSPNFLSPEPHFIELPLKSELFSRICYHPNEEGYKLMAKGIIWLLKKFHPSFVSEPVDNFQWSWEGQLIYFPDKYVVKKSLL
jgi:hypothetical protein